MRLVALDTMGTISARKRADGSTAYTAQIRLKEQGVIVHTEAQTFTKKALAQAWLKRREAVLQEARAMGALPKEKITVGQLLDAYVQQSKGITEWGAFQEGRHHTAAGIWPGRQRCALPLGNGPD